MRLFRTREEQSPRLVSALLLAIVAVQVASGQSAASEEAHLAVGQAVTSQRLAAVTMRKMIGRQRSATKTSMRQAAARQRMAAIRIQISPLAPGGPLRPLQHWSIPPNVSPAFAGVLCEPLSIDELNPILERVSAVQGLDPELVRAVIAQESGFRPCAVSAKGAVGLMQLMPAAIEDLEVQDAFDPEQNIGAGTRLLRRLLGRYNGDLALALAAYNAGPAKVDDADGIPPISETMQYVSDLLKKLPHRPPATTAPGSR